MEAVDISHDEVPSEVEATRSPDISSLQGIDSCEETENEEVNCWEPGSSVVVQVEVGEHGRRNEDG